MKEGIADVNHLNVWTFEISFIFQHYVVSVVSEVLILWQLRFLTETQAFEI